MVNKKRKPLAIILLISLISTIFYNIIGILIAATGYIADKYNETIQCLVWVVTIFICIILVGSIFLLILYAKKKYNFFKECFKRKIIYILATFGLTYSFSVIFVTLKKGYFDTTYMTTYISALAIIGAIAALIRFINNSIKKEDKQATTSIKQNALPSNQISMSIKTQQKQKRIHK